MRNSSVKLLPVLPDDKILRSLDDDNFLRTTIFSFPDFSITIVTFLFFFFFSRYRYAFRSTSIASSPRESASFIFFFILFFSLQSSKTRIIEKELRGQRSGFAFFFPIGDTIACK